MVCIPHFIAFIFFITFMVLGDIFGFSFLPPFLVFLSHAYGLDDFFAFCTFYLLRWWVLP